jgi:uncharacterized membrane protein HdeD (DUF308 family)
MARSRFAAGAPVAGLASLTLVIAGYLAAKGVLEGVIAFKLRPCREPAG